MADSPAGRFAAIGVGPGDPELLTLKAARLIRAADVVYHAGPGADGGRALEIIRALLRSDQQVRSVLNTAMADAGSGDGQAAYAAGVQQLIGDCRAGRSVVFITEGDSTLYSTAANVWQLLAERAPEIAIEVVPGVSSISAAAARVCWPLAQRAQPLLIVPARYHEADLQRWLTEFPVVCLLKPDKTLPGIRATLETLGQRREALYVEEVGTAREWLSADLSAAERRSNYFSLVLVRAVPLKSSAVATPSVPGVQVVGLGPGAPELLTQQARQALEQADVIVGYERYLEPLRSWGLRAELHGSLIGAETERARLALELARAGRRVVVVSSGDAGVFGMASLLLETAAREAPDLAIEVVPGVTAALAASALLGAPLGHDFACISLSDLLTPWPLIEQRLEAAARGDLVVALYNPVSQRRTWQLPRARVLLLAHRQPQTPVGLVERAYRPGERVRVTTLGNLTVDGIDMETLVLVGNSQTQVLGGRMVTPRGYLTSSVDPQGATANPPSTPGGAIMQESFRIIERELGAHSLPAWAFAVARRMIHASADFDFARTLRFSADFEVAAQRVFAEGLPVITDTEMVLSGIKTALAGFPSMTLGCHLNDPETRRLAESAGLTRSAAGVRIAAQKHRSPLLVIGNAPTALEEALRLVAEEGWRPAAIIGLPVGFVGVEEAKGRLLGQARVPYLTCVGRKGGSAVAAAAVNALCEF